MRKDHDNSRSKLQTVEASASSQSQIDSEAGICLFELVEDIIHRHQPLSRENQARLVCDIQSGLPSRMLLNRTRVSAILDDLAHFCVRHCQGGKVTLLFGCDGSSEVTQAQRMSVNVSILDDKQQPDLKYLQQFNQQMGHTHDAIRQLGGSITDAPPEQVCGLSFTLPYQTVTDAFEQHNHPESCILILEQDPATQTALQRILGEMSPNIQQLSDHRQLIQALTKHHSVSLLVLGLPEDEQKITAASDSVLHQLTNLDELRHIPVLALHAPGHSPPLPAHWKKLGKPIRKKGLLRVADRLIRQSLAPHQNQTRQVLVVEDNEINQKVISKLLNYHEIEFSIATDGEMAVRLFAEKPVDLILMDIHMPGVDGIEATRLIRQLNEDGAKVPIIAMTADTLHETRVRCKSVGINDALIKPLELEDIQTCVMSWLFDDGEIPKPVRSTVINPITNMREELHSMLLGMLPDYQKQLLGFAGQDDLTGLADTAHAISGAASYCGTDELKQAALDLETVLHADTAIDYKTALEDLLQAIRHLRR